MYLFETSKIAGSRIRLLLFLKFLCGFLLIAANHGFAVPADSVEIIARNAEINSSAIYQINFEISRPLSPKATIRVSFPDGFDLSDLMVAGSTTINGGFILKVDGQVVTMKRSGLGREIPAHEKVELKFAIVKNPRQPSETYNITIELLDEEEKTILKAEKQHKIVPARE